MSILSISYVEYPGDPRIWEFKETKFSTINLIVGKNATGKTRVLNLINGFCRLLGVPGSPIFDSGFYKVEILIEERIFKIEVNVSDSKVICESLYVDGEKKLVRREDGGGEIYYEKIKDFIEFQIPVTAFALQQKQDQLQHPFVVELANWARRTNFLSFNTSFVNNTFTSWSTFNSSATGDHPSVPIDVIARYSHAYDKYGKPLDDAIISDMKAIGYDISDVGTDDMRGMLGGINAPEPVLGMFVKECDRNDALLPQHLMSTGMFRALALLIFSNIAKFSQSSTVLSIDDIGEGLDFHRSVQLIKILERNVESSKLQLFMSTNDKFVMNNVDLKYWTILRRNAGIVHSNNYFNSKDLFEDFKFMGLNNFDLFSDSTIGNL